ncbi:MAG: hypothetical protein ACI4R8_04220 [Candidatus Caccovivens sp.]
MKKIILGLTAITLCLALSACGNSQSNATITSLSNQLDETANTISTMQTVNPSDITLTKSMLDSISSEDSSNAIYDNVICTQQALLNEQYYKADIMDKTTKIKNCLSKDIKLSNSQSSAVKDLTKSLGKYTNSISYTKNELNSSVKSIDSMKKNVSKNSDKINAKLNRIACNSNSRASYYENVLQTLDEIDRCLCLNSNKEESTPENESSTTTEQDNESRPSLKNIDTYLPNEANETTENQNNEIDQNNENEIENPNRNKNVYNRYNRYQLARNIDTYAPFNRNIDSYGRFGNGNYGGYGNFGNGNFGAPYNMPYAPYGYPYNNPNMMPYANPYGTNSPYGRYNSNNINQMQNLAYTNTENSSPRLEDFEEIKDGTVEDISENQNLRNKSTLTETKSNDCINCENKNEAESEISLQSEAKIKPVGNFNPARRIPAKHSNPKDDDDMVIAY